MGIIENNKLAEQLAERYLKHGGSLCRDCIKAYHESQSHGLFTLQEFQQAVYQQAGTDR